MKKRKLLVGSLWIIPAYVTGLFGSIVLIPLLTTNTHDALVEAAMTGAFVLGPLLALGGFLGGYCLTRA